MSLREDIKRGQELRKSNNVKRLTNRIDFIKSDITDLKRKIERIKLIRSALVGKKQKLAQRERELNKIIYDIEDKIDYLEDTLKGRESAMEKREKSITEKLKNE